MLLLAFLIFLIRANAIALSPQDNISQCDIKPMIWLDLYTRRSFDACAHLFAKKPGNDTYVVAFVWNYYYDFDDKDQTNKTNGFIPYAWFLQGDVKAMDQPKCESAFTSEDAQNVNKQKGHICKNDANSDTLYVQGWEFEKEGRIYAVTVNPVVEEPASSRPDTWLDDWENKTTEWIPCHGGGCDNQT